MEEVKRAVGEVQGRVKAGEGEWEEVRGRMEEGKRDTQRKMAGIYREMEKLGMAMEKKVAVEELNERLEGKADKQMVVNAVSNKVNRADMEGVLAGKAERSEVEAAVRALETRYAEEVQAVAESVGRKANVEDFQYYRKELNFKMDKSDLENFRQEYIDRVTALDFKLNETRQQWAGMEGKLESGMKEWRGRVGKEVDCKVEGKVDKGEWAGWKGEVRG